MVDLKLDIPDGFLEQEERCGYIISSKMKEVWAVELDLIRELDRVCGEHGIQYFADYGTLLGAVRHKGFIPWDDDVDLFMKREDYDLLCSYAGEFKHPFFFQTEETDPGGCRGHAQLRNSETTGALSREKSCLGINQGIFIDIFPIDRKVNNQDLFEKQLKRIKKWKYRASFIKKSAYMPDKKPGAISAVKKVYRGVHRILPVFDRYGDRCYRKFEIECRRYNDLDTDNYARICFPQFGKTVFSVEDIEESIRMPFEFIDIPVPIGYDSILTQLYGDYHNFIRSDTSHGAIVFDTDRDFKTVLSLEYGNTNY